MSFTGFSEARREGETVLEARPAWRSYAAHFIVIVGALLLDIFRVEVAVFLLKYFGIEIGPTWLNIIHVVLLIVPVIAVLKIARHRFSRKYVVRNDNRIISEHGYIGKHERSVPMQGVSIEVRQPFWGAILDFGDLWFRPGTEQVECAWEGVISPRKLRKDIENFGQNLSDNENLAKRTVLESKREDQHLGKRDAHRSTTTDKARMGSSEQIASEDRALARFEATMPKSRFHILPSRFGTQRDIAAAHKAYMKDWDYLHETIQFAKQNPGSGLSTLQTVTDRLNSERIPALERLAYARLSGLSDEEIHTTAGAVPRSKFHDLLENDEAIRLNNHALYRDYEQRRQFLLDKIKGGETENLGHLIYRVESTIMSLDNAVSMDLSRRAK